MSRGWFLIQSFCSTKLSSNCTLNHSPLKLKTMEEVEQQHSIPVVDLSNSDEDFVMRAVKKASQEWGVFQVVNHGIPTDLIQRLQKVGEQFFELSDEEKQSVANPKDSVEIQGYEKRDRKYVKSFVDHLVHAIWPPTNINYRYWPTNPPEYREVTEEYREQLQKLSEKILEWLSMGLGLRREALKEGLGGESIRYMLRINYYPPCLPSESAIGLPAHTDFGGLALLVPNDVSGLQVLKDDHLFAVEFIPSAVIVIIGDQIMRMSNGRYKNVCHQATLNHEKTRMSWPVFVSPRYDLVVGPLPELIGEENPSKFEALTIIDYIRFKKGDPKIANPNSKEIN